MLNVLLVILCVIIIICLPTWLFFKASIKNRKTNIYSLAIKDSCVINFKNLNVVIYHYFINSLNLIVIQDDIKFASPNFYWPKNTIYIHFSDAKSIATENYIAIMFSNTFEENLSFLKTKVYIT